MSSTEDTVELKAGHAPAVKVGGMRIVQSKHPHVEKTPSKEEKKSESEDGPEKDNNNEEGENEDQELEEQKKDKSRITVSGAPARGNADFPAEAVKAYHDKPYPTKAAINHVPVNNVANHVVNQPRRSNHSGSSKPQ